MAVLSRAAGVAATLTALAGCYSPLLRDCKVSCESQHDCATGQVCGSDGLCASPEVAGRCASLPPDAGPSARDAATDVAADVAIDGPTRLTLHVMIAGKGSVVVEGQGICSSAAPQRGDCTYQVVPSVAQTVHAVMTQLDQVFTGWTSATCGGEGATCTFTLVDATTIAARFEHGG
jgi:hypothetical protein